MKTEMKLSNQEATVFKSGYKRFFSNVLNKMQKLGRTFMLPIAILAFCGILLGIGASLTSESVISQMPWLATRGVYDIMVFLKTIGTIGFTFLPFMFVMAIPLGLASDNSGTAAFAGFIAFISLLLGISFILTVLPENLTAPGTFIGKSVQTIIGIKTMDVGVLGAIIIGICVYLLHEKFQYISLPNAISFWGGIRFVPLISMLIFSVAGVLVAFIWPCVTQLIFWIGQGVQYTDWFGPFLYRFTESLVRPTGMHHVINSIVRFTAVGGTYTMADGTEVVGALNIFYAQLAAGVPVSAEATRFLSQGYMPTLMFGLPCAAMAIYFLAEKEQKPMVKSVIVPGIIACVVGGITEPLEFLFLFIAPMLYFIHCIFIGLAYMVVGLLGVRIGNTDGNIIDFVVFGIMQGLYTRWYLILVVGPIWGVIYFFGFYFYIKWRDVKIIGRTELTPEEKQSLLDLDRNKKIDYSESAGDYLALLGGAGNIKTLTNCYTRLRVTVKEPKLLSQEEVKNLGALGVKQIDDNNLQIIIGPSVEKLKNEILKKMKG